MNTTKTALVVGGGIAGPVAAMALQKAGVRATLYETHRTPTDAVGGGITLAPNGLAALDIVGCGDLARNLGSPITGIELRSGTGKVLGSFASGAGDAASRFLWRGAISEALMRQAQARGIRVVRGVALRDATTDADTATAVFDDGSIERADLLVAADGIRSRTRTIIDAHAPAPVYTGLLGFGGTVRDSGLEPTGGLTIMTFGRRAFFGLHVTDDATAEWFANMPSKDAVAAARLRAEAPEARLRSLADAFSGDRSPASVLISRTEPADLVVAGPLEIMPLVPHWSRGRLVLVGDAAHAASPSSGQGASLAAESAVELARAVRDLPVDAALREYESSRRPRVERIIKGAERTNSSKTAGPVGRWLRDTMMPIAFKLMKPPSTAWQTDYRIDWDAVALDELLGS